MGNFFGELAKTVDDATGTNFSGEHKDSNSPFQNISKLTDYASNFLSGGFLGYSKNGFDPKSGFYARTGLEGVGEVTGRNAAREANYENRVGIDAAAAERNAEIKAQQFQNYSNNVAASNTAGALRKSANAQSIGGAGFSIPSGPTTDFLGL